MTENPMNALIAAVTACLEDAGVAYAITGSVASSIHGEPVTSLDVDIVVVMTPGQAAEIAERLPPPLYIDQEQLRAAAFQAGMSNLYDLETGLKIDISVLEDDAYSNAIMSRRVQVRSEEGQRPFWVVSAEDVILMKLVRRRDSRSSKQWANALSVARVQGGRLDWGYLRAWAAKLSIESDLQSLMEEAGI